MKFKQELIDQLKDGKIALQANGDLPLLNAVLSFAFPEDEDEAETYGSYKYFYRGFKKSGVWRVTDHPIGRSIIDKPDNR